MIELTSGDILQAKADALVNTVNCVGVMGRGIALQFKKAFPEMFKAYQAACKREDVVPCKVFTYDLNRLEPPHYVINFPTKRHWKGKSRMEDIEAGLLALVDEVTRLNIKSIAVPPLGCGLGGLDWGTVRTHIESAFESLPDVRVIVYEPKGAPSAEEMARNEKTPKMTIGRAALLGLMRRYLAGVMEPFVTLLEIHKLMYFMQEAGEPLRLNYTKGLYGLYAENLRHVLTHIEGHFILGYGDAADDPDKPIELKQDAVPAAEVFLGDHPAVHERFDRVGELIAGFESSFGLELLSSVHWVACHEQAADADAVVSMVHQWNERKSMFKDEHIRLAYQVLNQKHWLKGN